MIMELDLTTVLENEQYPKEARDGTKFEQGRKLPQDRVLRGGRVGHRGCQEIFLYLEAINATREM